MGNKVITTLVIIVGLAGFVLLALTTKDTDKFVTFFMLVATTISVGYNNNKTENVSERLGTVETNTNGHLTTLTDILSTRVTAIETTVQEIQHKLENP